MRIIIFSDSLARPRPDINPAEKTEYEDIYGYKLKSYFYCKHDVEILWIESLDTNDAIFWSERMVAFRKPDLVILHLGINDCAPRIFKKQSIIKCILQNEYVKKYTFNLIPRILGKFRYPITKYFPKTYTSLNDFEKNILKIISTIKSYNRNCHFLCLSILENPEMDKKSFNFTNNVKKYNKVLKKIFKENFIDINKIEIKNKIISDGIHLSKEAHEEIFRILKNKIKKLEIK